MNFKFVNIIMLVTLFSAFNAALTKNPDTAVQLLKDYVKTEAKIINGTEALWNGTRYQVSLRLREYDWLFGVGQICGGSLISEDIILSAGHCIWNSETKTLREHDEFSVVMGNVNRFSRENVLVFNVTKISMLPTFNVTTFTDDVAILFLNGKVPKNYTFASPIALNVNRNIERGTLCEVSGWGISEMGNAPANLMIVDVPIINRTICSKGYGDLLADGMICAGYIEGERDACFGDSGGPLVCDQKLVGVVSFGFQCATPNYPGVYADVAHYVNWIRQEMGINGASTNMPISLFGIFFTAILIYFNIDIILW